MQNFSRTSQLAMLADGRWVKSDENWAAGVNADDTFFPDDYPDSEDSPEDRKTFIHGEGANFVYLDGHTEWLEYSNYSTNGLLWENDADLTF